jgi:hypothetical protein
MNDFFQSLSFHGLPVAKGGPASLRAGPIQRCIMQSFDEIPFTAFRPTPTAPRSRKRSVKSSIVNRKS